MFRDQPLAVIKMADGRPFTIHKITHGKHHYYFRDPSKLTPVEKWVNPLISRFISRQIPFSPVFDGFATATPTMAIWHTFDWKLTEPDSTPVRIVVTDAGGWRTEINTSDMRDTEPSKPTLKGERVAPQWISFEIPSESSELKMEFFDSNGECVGAGKISAPVPKSLLQKWELQQFPASSTSDNFRVTLKGLAAKWTSCNTAPPYAFSGDVLDVTPELVVEIDGAESKSWIPMTEGATNFDDRFNGGLNVASIESLCGVMCEMSLCTVSPFTSAWKVRLPFICCRPEEVIESEKIPLTATSFDPDENPLDHSTDSFVGQSKVRFLGTGREGVYEYKTVGEGRWEMTLNLPVDYLTGNRLQGSFHSARSDRMPGVMTPGIVTGSGSLFPKYPLSIQAALVIPRPFVALSIVNTDDRFPLVIVNDQNGRRLDGDLINLQGLLIWVAKTDCEDVRKIDAFLILQKPRQFTFVVPPPPIPPRETQVNPLSI